MGRRSDFDSRSDSAVRVEVHRLRKRLKEFYDDEGAALSMQIVLPPGQYTPQFLILADGDSPAAASPKGFTARRLSWIWLGLSAVLLVAAIWACRGQKRDLGTAASAGPSPSLTSQSEVRLLAGFPSGKYIDQYGHLWTGDAYFQGGTAADVRYALLARTANPALYHHARQGFEFGYEIPLKPGAYEMRLHFAGSSMHVPIVDEIGYTRSRVSIPA